MPVEYELVVHHNHKKTMKTLKDLLHTIDHEPIPESIAGMMVASLVNDSRHIVSGCVFLAARGLSSHALDYLTSEQCEQAVAIVYESDYDVAKFATYQHKFIAVPALHQHISAIGKAFYAPQFSQPLIGVTGTNGKTSVTQFIAQLADYACIGTMGYGRPQALTELSHTTPNALQTQAILAALSQQVTGVAMEVSSHALRLYRVDAVDFRVAVFTNLTQDHLDFHHDMEDYFEAKSDLFCQQSVQSAVINVDDEYGYRLAQTCMARGQRVLAFGQGDRVAAFDEGVIIQEIRLSQRGIAVDLALRLQGQSNFYTLMAPVWGVFNAYNVVAAVLALYAAGDNVGQLLTRAQRLRGVLGRIDPLAVGEKKIAIIDYAHTPDALKNTLESLRAHMLVQANSELHSNSGRIYTVFGCGGERDKRKRPLMAEAVNAYSDFGIITDDNPRTEDPQAIFADMLTGDIDRIRFQVIPSRAEAIRFGLSRLSENDVLLIAGKGHEPYQIIGTEKIHFSDYEVVQDWVDENV